MLDNKLLQLIDDTSIALELASAIIEKDFYVTQIIQTLSNTENDYFRLVFAGGTCLAKAHKIVNRMSEDVDFKIQTKIIKQNFSKSRFLKELKQFRSLITSKISISGLTFEPPIVRNDGQYLRIELNYPSAYPVSTRLRPHILLEFTLADIRLGSKNLPIRTLIEDTLENVTLLEPSLTLCISVDETAIEKWVGLTRRIVAIKRNYHPDDPTLIRHVYDLNAIIYADKINNNFYTLAKTIINYDADQFKNQHPEYSIDPSKEIQQSLNILKNKPIWKTRYQDFIESMVYGETPLQDYDSVIQILETMSSNIITSLNKIKNKETQNSFI